MISGWKICHICSLFCHMNLPFIDCSIYLDWIRSYLPLTCTNIHNDYDSNGALSQNFLILDSHKWLALSIIILSINDISESAGACPNIKMLSYQYRDFHYKDRMLSLSSHLHSGIPFTWKDSLYIETGPRSHAIMLKKEIDDFKDYGTCLHTS